MERAIAPARIVAPGNFQTFFSADSRTVHHSTMVGSVSLLNLEIVGLARTSLGRSCTIHECCGEHVEAGSLLRVVPSVASVNGQLEEIFKCVHVTGGADGCTVALVPRYFVEAIRAKSRAYSFVQVIEVYDHTTSKRKLEKSKANGGMASCIFLEDIPISE